MTSDERIARLEAQIETLKTQQSELYQQLAQAQRDQWQGRIEDLEVQMHLGAMEANDKAAALMDELRGRWAEARGQFDEAVDTASGVGDALRTGLERAVRDLRGALLESKHRITS
jgi:hypothetical protein